MTGRQHSLSVCGGGVKSRLISALHRFPSSQFSSGGISWWRKNAALISNGRGTSVQMLHKVLGKKYCRNECSSSPPDFGIDSTGSHTCASYLSSLQILVALSVQLSGLEVSALISCSRVVFTSPSEWLGCSLRAPWALVVMVDFCI